MAGNVDAIASDLAIDCAAATFAYDDTKPVCDAVDLTLARGARLVLAGPNGAGKTTLLRLFAGRRRPSSGSVRVLGHDAFTHTPLANQVAFIGNEWGDEGMNAPVAWMAASAARGADPERAVRLGEALGLAALLHQDTAKLSSGQRRRVQLFCQLLPPRELLLLDEATNSLDVTARAALLDWLKAECDERGATVVFVTHVFDGLDGWATAVAHLDRGRVLRRADPQDAAQLPPGSLHATVRRWMEAATPADEIAARRARERPLLLALANFEPPPKPAPAPALAPAPAPAKAPPPPAAADGQPSAYLAAAHSLPLGWNARHTSGAFGGHSWGTVVAPAEPAVNEAAAADALATAATAMAAESAPKEAPPPAAPPPPELPRGAKMMVGPIQTALASLRAQSDAAAAAVPTADLATLAASIAQIGALSAVVQQAVAAFETAVATGDAPTVARAADVPGDDRDPPPEAGGGDDSLPFGWGERQSNLSERELVRRGKIVDGSGA